VTCENNANSVSRKWAYLLENNLYVLLATVTRGSSETHEITGVDYVQ
jgi:hypothetical protein